VAAHEGRVSLDGRTALADGTSQWITGAAARTDGHAWRKRAGAVLTGVGTVREDDPRLDVRLVASARQPLRVIVDSRLETPPEARIVQPPGAVLVYAAVDDGARRAALEQRGAEVVLLPSPAAKVDLAAMVADLGRRGINELHVEAGEKLNASLLAAGLVDELLVYVAPRLLGSGRGLAALRRSRAWTTRSPSRSSPSIASATICASFCGPPPHPDLRLTRWRRRNVQPTPTMGAMFTGIVSAVGRIVEVEPLGNDASFGKALTVATLPGWLAATAVGDSIAIAGACMTVVALEPAQDRFRIEISAASLGATNGLDRVGDVNLEKALRAGDRLDGHLVSGHVDGVGTVTRFEHAGESWRLGVAAPVALARFLAFKGSVAVDGVSLTVNDVADGADGCEFSVNLIAHTVEHTTLRGLAVGRKVNLEVDLIARYVERMLGSAHGAG
jgi:riboflavin synthase, alpha subunit